MKIRNSFVSNSSSSSFIIQVYKFDEKNTRRITEVQEKLLVDNGFEFTMQIDPAYLSREDLVAIWEKETFWDDTYNYGFVVECNQDNTISFLLKNKIPFVADVHYGHKSIRYEGKETVYIARNFGREMTSDSDFNPAKYKNSLSIDIKDREEYIKYLQAYIF